MSARKINKKKPTKERKKQVSLACVACRKAKTACDNQRPCHRCATRGIENCCDAPKKSRANNKKSCVAAHNHAEKKKSKRRLINHSHTHEDPTPTQFESETMDKVEGEDISIDISSLVVLASGSCTGEVIPTYSSCPFFNALESTCEFDPSCDYTPFGGINVLGIINTTPSFDQMLASILSDGPSQGIF